MKGGPELQTGHRAKDKKRSVRFVRSSATFSCIWQTVDCCQMLCSNTSDIMLLDFNLRLSMRVSSTNSCALKASGRKQVHYRYINYSYISLK